MCGICGIYRTKPLPDHEFRLQRMLARMHHRGPDQQGLATHPDGLPQGLAASRLAIVDCARGAQPFADEDGRVIVALNGEIYNYRELRRDLLSRRARLRSSSDTEVLLHTYKLYGEACFARLNGMFAAAIWDLDQQQLLLARDRLGQKPLFYQLGPDGLLFASELKALLASGLVDFAPEPDKIADFLSVGYTPGPESILRGVKNMDPGTYLKLDASLSASTRRYWRLTIREEAPASDPHEKFLQLFRGAVKERLSSDHPVGVFLSSGVDSSAILAAMKEQAGYAIPAFIATFDEPEFNEVPALLHSRLLDGVNLETVRCGPGQVISELDQMVLASDNLLANPAMIALSALSRRAHERGVKSVLTGGGADELLFGYPTYLADRVSLSSSWLDALLQKIILPGAAAVLPIRFGRMPPSYIVKKYLETSHIPAVNRHYWWRTIFTSRRREALLRGHNQSTCEDTYGRTYRKILEDESIRSVYNRFSLADLTIWWRDMGLYMADCISMAHSLESRAPFMDHRLVEFVFSLPINLKMRGLRSKPFLRRAFRPLLPARVRNRPKLSFAVPLAPWLAGPLRTFASDNLAKDAIRSMDILNPEPIQQILAEHCAMKHDHSYRIWALLCLVRWHAMMKAEAAAGRSSG